MSTQTIRQSTILIASGDRTNVYSSLDQVPDGLKRKLMNSTSGTNSATILLADRAGREEIVRALRGMPSHVQARIATPKVPWTEAFARKHANSTESATPCREIKTRTPTDLRSVTRQSLKWARSHWPELLLPVGVAIGLWALLVS